MKEIPEYATKELERARKSLLAAKILLESDYDVEIEINEERAEQRFYEAKRFVERIEKYIQELTRLNTSNKLR